VQDGREGGGRGCGPQRRPAWASGGGTSLVLSLSEAVSWTWQARGTSAKEAAEAEGHGGSGVGEQARGRERRRAARTPAGPSERDRGGRWRRLEPEHGRRGAMVVG